MLNVFSNAPANNRSYFSGNTHYTKTINSNNITDENGKPKVYYGDPKKDNQMY